MSIDERKAVNLLTLAYNEIKDLILNNPDNLSIECFEMLAEKTIELDNLLQFEYESR